MKFNERLQKLRKERGYSQEDLAELLHISRQAVSKWESGVSYPETEKLIELSRLFSISIDELLKEERVKEPELVDPIRVEEYAKFYKKFQLAISIGVCLCILSIIMGALVHDLFHYNYLTIISFFFPVMIAVGLFVYYGISYSNYEDFHEEYLKRVIDPTEKKKFNIQFAIAMTIGVSLCIIGILLGGVVDETIQQDGYTTLAFFGPVLVAVFLFVYYGLGMNSYREESSQQSFKKNNNLCERIQSVIMLLATSIFLLFGFLSSAWHPAWVVFPIGGILCGIVSVIFDE